MLCAAWGGGDGFAREVGLMCEGGGGSGGDVL